jgi:hypothetical protein
MTIKYITIFVISALILIILYNLFINNYEHASSVSNNILSNEAIQNMSSVLNTGNGTITNLTITGQLKIGNVTINPDGTITGATVNDPIINGGSINNSNLIGSNLSWPTTNNKWYISTEGGDNLVVRNLMAKTDSRYAFAGDGNWNFGNNSSTIGDISVNNIIASSNVSGHNVYASGDVDTIGSVIIGQSGSDYNLTGAGDGFRISSGPSLNDAQRWWVKRNPGQKNA